MNNYDDILAVLACISRNDIHESLWWRCDGEYSPVTFFVNCNDLFYWACADCEPFTAEDVAAMDAAIADAGPMYGPSLWCCRKRAMRPQKPAYPTGDGAEKMARLYDACGPERDPKDEG